jgi:hypothetical protein
VCVDFFRHSLCHTPPLYDTLCDLFPNLPPSVSLLLSPPEHEQQVDLLLELNAALKQQVSDRV